MEYWDLDDFLAEEEKVTTTFLCNSFENGEIENLKGADIEDGKLVEMPIWLAKALENIKVVDIEEPIYFKDAFKKAIWSDPEVFYLREKYGYLYEHAVKLQHTISDKAFLSCLYSILEKRNREFYRVSKHIRSEETMSYKKKMSQFEERIFQASLGSALEYSQWKSSKKDSNTILKMAYKKIKST